MDKESKYYKQAKYHYKLPYKGFCSFVSIAEWMEDWDNTRKEVQNIAEKIDRRAKRIKS